MGLSLAVSALHRGANVTLVHGVASWQVPSQINAIPVVTAEQMRQAMLRLLPNADIIIMSAAVADVKPHDYSFEKLPKKALPETLALAPVPDIISELAQHKQPHQKLIGFAAQTGDIIAPALDKLYRKNLDAIIANPIDKENSGFGGDQNEAIYIDKKNQLEIPSCSKLKMAHHIFDILTRTQKD
jgi:phosphopantothenoylcysteine decarboxylase/phosphopantothenate--cysteine ligase